MNPVRGYTMLNFLNWLATHHPEVPSLKGLDEETLVGLVNEFEGGKLSHNFQLKEKWLQGFRYLINNWGDWEGYGEARRRFESMER